MSLLRFSGLVLLLAVLFVPAALADDGVRQETRVDEARSEYGVSGEGVLVVVFDRGIDYEHADFRNADGTTRIRAIYDLSSDAGASDPDNPTGFGTVYTRAEIDAALSSGNRLAHRDAVGHGTATAGLAAGNGRASAGRYAGMAPNAELVVVKFTSEGAAAHDGEPAEQPFFRPELLPVALDYVIGLAEDAGMPLVVIANFGSIQGPMDGTSLPARQINQRFGPGIPGRVFITGSSDDGGVANHTSGTVPQGGSVDVEIEQASGPLRLSLWYPAEDRFSVQITRPDGTVFGPYAPPSNSQQQRPSTSGFAFYHNGSQVDFFGAASATREVLIDFGAAQSGTWTVRLTGESVTDGTFHGAINPANIIGAPPHRILSPVVAGSTVWDWATAVGNLCPNSYVLRDTWTDVDGTTRTYVGNSVGPGELWPGSGVGPTYDGRLGIHVSVPGNSNIGAYAPRSIFATGRGNVIEDGPSPYGILGAVSGAAPVLTGIVALMLEADPTLDADEVRTILQETARADAFTGPVPNPAWGHGKVDAFAAVQRVVMATPSEPEPTAAGLTLSAFPQPFRGRATVMLSLEGPAQQARVALYDALGRRVATLHDGPLAAGAHPLQLEGNGLPAGVYVLRAQTESGGLSRRVVLAR